MERNAASVYDAVGELRAAGCEDEAEAVERLVAERDQLRRERDDFEQRLHAHQRGEHG